MFGAAAVTGPLCSCEEFIIGWLFLLRSGQSAWQETIFDRDFKSFSRQRESVEKQRFSYKNVHVYSSCVGVDRLQTRTQRKVKLRQWDKVTNDSIAWESTFLESCWTDVNLGLVLAPQLNPDGRNRGQSESSVQGYDRDWPMAAPESPWGAFWGRSEAPWGNAKETRSNRKSLRQNKAQLRQLDKELHFMARLFLEQWWKHIK